MLLPIKKLVKYAKLPTKAHPSDACFDLYSSDNVSIAPFGVTLVKTGLAIEMTEGYEAQIRGRSGLATRGIFVILGTIDSGYRGDLGVIMFNSTPEYFRFKRGDRIAQMAIKPVLSVQILEVEEINKESDRGEAGFGSTGD